MRCVSSIGDSQSLIKMICEKRGNSSNGGMFGPLLIAVVMRCARRLRARLPVVGGSGAPSSEMRSPPRTNSEAKASARTVARCTFEHGAKDDLYCIEAEVSRHSQT